MRASENLGYPLKRGIGVLWGYIGVSRLEGLDMHAKAEDGNRLKTKDAF